MSVLRASLLVLSASLCLAGTAQAQSDAAKAFGARDRVRDVSLSPDGKQLAVVQTLAGSGSYGLFVAPLDGSEALKPILASKGGDDQLMGCGWVTNARLICEARYFQGVGYERIGYTRMVAINADGSKFQLLTARTSGNEYSYMQNGGDVIDWMADDPKGSVLMTREVAPEYSTGTLMAEDRQGLAVERVDTETLRRVRVEPPKPDAAFFMSDQFGQVRL
jgi:hypothetical protein